MWKALVIGPEDNLSREFIQHVGELKDFSICHHVSQYPQPAELTALLERSAPDVVVMNLADYGRALRTINRLALAKPSLPVIALHTHYDSPMLLELMQLGVRELWFPPFNVEQMGQAMDRLHRQSVVASPRADSRPPGALIAFLPARGGCGTTTVAFHTAAALGKMKASVLLADFDFHNSIIAFWMKLDPKHGFQEALERAHWLDSSVWNSMVNRVSDIDVLTAPQTFAPLAFSAAETAAVLDFTRQNYHFGIVDLPDAIYSSCWEVLEHADQILLTATPEMSSLYLARRKVAQIVDNGIPRGRIRVLLNRCSPLDIKPEEVAKFLSLPVAASFGNHYRAVTTAFADAKLVPEASKLGAEFFRFARSLAGTPDKQELKSNGWKMRQIFSPV